MASTNTTNANHTNKTNHDHENAKRSTFEYMIVNTNMVLHHNDPLVSSIADTPHLLTCGAGHAQPCVLKIVCELATRIAAPMASMVRAHGTCFKLGQAPCLKRRCSFVQGELSTGLCQSTGLLTGQRLHLLNTYSAR